MGLEEEVKRKKKEIKVINIIIKKRGQNMGTEKKKETTENENQSSLVATKMTEETLAKIAISKEADSALVEIIAKVSDGFDGARVVKQDVASHIILEFFKSNDETDIFSIRKLFFDTKAMLRAVLKKAEETGYIPDDVEELFRKKFESTAHSAKKPKKNLKSEGITDRHLESEAP